MSEALMNPLIDSEKISNKAPELQNDEKHSNGRWTKQEHQRFLDAVKFYGKNWRKVEEYVGTRNSAQIRSHAQKFFQRLEKELKSSHTTQKANRSLNEIYSERKFSEGSISTLHTQPDNLWDFERSEDQLKGNLAPNKKCAIDGPKSNSMVTDSKSFDTKNIEEEVQGSNGSEIKQNNCQINQARDQSHADSHDAKTHLLTKIHNIQASISDYEKLINNINPFKIISNISQIQASVQKHNTPSIITATTNNHQFPVQQRLQRHHVVYLDLMNYFSRFSKNRKNIKLSDLVELSTERSTSDEENYEMNVAKKLRQN